MATYVRVSCKTRMEGYVQPKHTVALSSLHFPYVTPFLGICKEARPS